MKAQLSSNPCADFRTRSRLIGCRLRIGHGDNKIHTLMTPSTSSGKRVFGEPVLGGYHSTCDGSHTVAG